MVDISGFNFHFSDNEYVQVSLEAILESFGEAFLAPFTTDLQPVDTTIFNAESLLQFDLPAGMMIPPLADVSSSFSIGNSINSLMQGLAPIMSAYGFLMPIFQVIIGIIEVLCALMNPWAVKKAVKRLLKNYIPKLVKLFPAIAGVILVLNIIKMIIAIIVYFLTVILALIELIKSNAKLINDEIKRLADGGGLIDQLSSDDKLAAGNEKIKALIVWLSNQLGLLKAFKPVLDIILAILKMTGLKWPCKKDCCDDDVCPKILREPPDGIGILTATSVPDELEDKYSGPYFAFKITTTNERVKKLKKYYNGGPNSVGSKNDDLLDACCPAGGDDLDDCPNLNLEISSRRGIGGVIVAPIVKIKDKTITVINPKLKDMLPPKQPKISIKMPLKPVSLAARIKDIIGAAGMGAVNYKVVPNFDILFARGIISLGCLPEIEEARNEAEAAFGEIDTPVVGDPDIGDLGDWFNGIDDAINAYVDRLNALTAPYNLDEITAVQVGMADDFNGFINDAKRRLRGISGRFTNINNSTIEVDKNVVRSDFTDFATITVTPRDRGDNAILRNLPEDSIPDVEIQTSFGTLQNKRFDRAAGSIVAELKSPLVGRAEITATINGQYIADLINGINTIRKVDVRFVSDSVLPTRRKMPVTVDKEPKRG